jgi:hypothetical protein
MSIGKIDAMVFVAGVFTGAFLFTESFPMIEGLANAQYRGPVRVNETLGLSPGLFAMLMVAAAVAMFCISELAEKKYARPEITNDL